MPFCSNCGAILTPEMKFCGGCGTPAMSANPNGSAVPGFDLKKENSGVDRSTSNYQIQQTIYQGGIMPFGSAAQLIECESCGSIVEAPQSFRCRNCGRKPLCREHCWDKDLRICIDCAAKLRKSPEPREIYIQDLHGGVALEMIWIPGGTFIMGSAERETQREKSEGPLHTVNIQGFWMGKFEVTQLQWRAIMGTSVAQQRDKVDPESVLCGEGDGFPIYFVNWDEANEFCHRLTFFTGKTYLLPTKSQWEYACRAGTTTPFSFGYTISTNQSNYDGNYVYGLGGHKGIFREKTTKSGCFMSNNFGLYDMHGNVWEWCQDDFHRDYIGAPTDGSAWKSVTAAPRVLRGGSWYGAPRLCRSAYRYKNLPDVRRNDIGFRVCSPGRNS